MPHQIGSDQQSLQHNVHYTQTTRSLHRSQHGACQRHLSERSHLVMAFLYCQFTTEGLDIIKILNIQGHKNHTEHSSHNTLFHSNTQLELQWCITQFQPNYTYLLSFMHCQSAHNLLPRSISVTHFASYNISTTVTKLYSRQQTQWEIKQY